jgi:serine/threonine-protein kinase
VKDVYAAQATDSGERLAIGVLHRELASEQGVAKKFHATVEAWRRLKHPSLIELRESGETPEGIPWLGMEMVEGEPLSLQVEQGVALRPALAVAVIRGVLQGLQAEHRAGVVHRCLDLSCIFLHQPPGGEPTVKLSDVGLHLAFLKKRFDLRKAGGGMAQAPALPRYTSPSFLRNESTIDPRDDLWSVGAIFFELLSGRDPYEASSEFARMTAKFQQEPPAVDRDAPELALFQPFLARTLVPARAQGWQTAEEMLGALDALA